MSRRADNGSFSKTIGAAHAGHIFERNFFRSCNCITFRSSSSAGRRPTMDEDRIKQHFLKLHTKTTVNQSVFFLTAKLPDDNQTPTHIDK